MCIRDRSAAIQAVVQHEQAKQMIIVDVVAGNGAITYDECFLHHLDAEIIINSWISFMQFLLVKKMHFTRCVWPVSYTHLDVYKRQAEAWISGQQRSISSLFRL